ncbi:MAG: hypothetical protein ACRDQZ_25535 [Mycobacteriales bacterium]
MSKSQLAVTSTPLAVTAGETTLSVGVGQVINNAAFGFKVYDANQVLIGSIAPNGTFVWAANKSSGDPFLPGETVGYIALGSGYAGSVTGVAPNTKTFQVSGDHTAALLPGITFLISGSTGNDKKYTVVSATYDSSDTDIVVQEVIPDPTVDGTITVTVYFNRSDLNVVPRSFVLVSQAGSSVGAAKGLDAGDGLSAVLSSDGQTMTFDSRRVTALAADGAIPVKSGLYPITKAGVAVLTLATPVAGGPGVGDDGKVLAIVDAGGHAHTIATAANKINGADDLGTFGGTAGSSIVLRAYNGVWYSFHTENGVTLSEV